MASSFPSTLKALFIPSELISDEIIRLTSPEGLLVMLYALGRRLYFLGGKTLCPEDDDDNCALLGLRGKDTKSERRCGLAPVFRSLADGIAQDKSSKPSERSYFF